MNWLQSLLVFVSRIFFSLIFFWSGMYHLYNWEGPLSYWVLNPVTMNKWILMGIIIVQLVSALFLCLGFLTRFFSLVLLVFLAYISFYFYDYTSLDQIGLNEVMSVVLKNVAIMGGLLMLFAFGPGKYSMDQRKRAYRQKVSQESEEE